jgi:hypothetical protein
LDTPSVDAAVGGGHGSPIGQAGLTGSPGTDAATTAGGNVDAGGAGGILGGAGGQGGSVAIDSGTSQSCLSVIVTTVTANGNYSPRNVGAIWIASDNGAFIKTLAVWARQRISRLTLWRSTTFQAGLGNNTVDAITGATLSNHQTHQVSWNCTDATRKPVPDGGYRVYFEMTDRNGSGPNTFVTFTKGPIPFNQSYPDQSNFKGLSLVYAP